jgi:hypothetical protein
VIYLDSSVALAHLLAEDRLPPESIWSDRLVASRLLEYEVWVELASFDERQLAAARALGVPILSL